MRLTGAPGAIPGIDSLLSFSLHAGRAPILALTAVLIATIAYADWLVGLAISLGVLYIFPAMIAALAFTPLESALLALFCAFLRYAFDVPVLPAETFLRFAFAAFAYFSASLFVIALVRNHKDTLNHLAALEREQALRSGAEQQLATLIESSPAAILTLNRSGLVLAANQAAASLFALDRSANLLGRSIAHFLPVLADALRFPVGPELFRTAAQSQGRREDGEIFLAQTWFSSFGSGENARLAAIVVDTSEEMQEREEANLRQLTQYNRIAAAGVSHEVRNVSAALSLLLTNLARRHALQNDEDFAALANLVSALQNIAALNLRSHTQETFEHVSLQTVLDSLRILVDSKWREIGGVVSWPSEASALAVAAEPHGLLQVFLNLAQNSFQAVAARPLKQLHIDISVIGSSASVAFRDSGAGVSDPARLFQPFHSTTNGAGLGLYISRAILRTYGGDLRYEPAAEGACFLVQLQIGAL